MIATIVLAGCAASTGPSDSAGSSLASPAPSAPASVAPSGPPSTTLEEIATAQLTVEGGPDWPTELGGSLWILAPDWPLIQPGEPPVVYRLDPETGEEQARIAIPGRFCQTLAAGFGSLWACADEGMLRIDPATNAVVATIPLPAPRVSGRSAIGPDAVWALAGETMADSVVRIDADTDAVSATYPLGHAVDSLAYGFGALWATATSDGLLLRIDPVTGAVTEHVSDLPSPARVQTGAGAIWLFLYASSDGPQPAEGDPDMLRIDPETGASTPVEIGRNPVGEADVWATDEAVWVRGIDPALVRLDPESGAIVWSATASPAGAGSVTEAFGSVWVTTVEFSDLWQIDPDDAR